LALALALALVQLDPMVVILRLHPPAIWPVSAEESSSTNRFQPPFAACLLKTDNAEEHDASGGAGGGKGMRIAVGCSGKLDGLKAPDVIGRGSKAAFVAGSVVDAASSKVSVTGLAILKPPPVSSIRTAHSPPGPCSSMLTSSANEWVRPLIVTVTFLTLPLRPVALMVEGNGLAGPTVVPGAPAGIVMSEVFEKVLLVWAFFFCFFASAAPEKAMEKANAKASPTARATSNH
jgi:hypothetical protein